MTRKLTARQRLIKAVAQEIYDTNGRRDFSDIPRAIDQYCLSDHEAYKYYLEAGLRARQEVRRQIKREVGMAQCVIERSGKALVEIEKEEESEPVATKQERTNSMLVKVAKERDELKDRIAELEAQITAHPEPQMYIEAKCWVIPINGPVRYEHQLRTPYSGHPALDLNNIERALKHELDGAHGLSDSEPLRAVKVDEWRIVLNG